MTDKPITFRGLNSLLEDTPIKENDDGLQSSGEEGGAADEGEEGGEGSEGQGGEGSGEEDEAGQGGVEKKKPKPTGVTITPEDGEGEEETEEEKATRIAAEAAAAEEAGEGGEGEGGEGDEDATFFEKAATATGYEIEGEFEPNEEGLLDYTGKLAKTMADDMVQQVFGKNPLVKTFIDFLDNGGKPEAFFQVQHPVMDYAKVAIPADDENSAEEMVKHYYQRKGLPAPQVLQLVTFAKESGTLHTDAVGFLAELKETQTVEKTEQLKTQQLAAAQEEEKSKEYWNGVEQTVKAGKIGQINLAEKARQPFYDWLTLPVNKEGQTQREVDFAALTEEETMTLEWLVHNKFTALYTKLKKPTKGGKAAKDAVETMLTKTKQQKAVGTEEKPDVGGSKETFKPIAEIL